MSDLQIRPTKMDENILDLGEPDSAPNAYYPNYGIYQDEKLHLRDYWRIIRSHIWLIVGITIISTLIAVIYMARQPDIYEAKARVQVDLENMGTRSGSSEKGTLILNNTGTDPAYFNTQLQILKGEALQRRVVKTLDLDNNPDFFKGSSDKTTTWKRLTKMVGLGGGSEESENDNQVEKIIGTNNSERENETPTSEKNLAEAQRLSPFVSRIKNSLNIEPVRENSLPNKETRLIEVKFTHSDPKAAAKVVNTVADTFVLSNMERRVENNVSTGDFLSKRVAELQVQIRNGEERLINYAKNNQIISLDASQNTVVDRLVGLNKQLLEAENERKIAEAAYRSGSQPNAAEALADLETKATGYQVKIAELKQKRAELLVDYTEKYPEVKQIDDQLKVLEDQLNQSKSRITGNVKTNLETRYKSAVARETAIREAFDKQKAETVSQNVAAVNYRIIQQEIETNKNLLKGLLQQAKENDVLKAESINNISVAEYAITPRAPVGPKRFFGISLVFMLSLVIAVCLSIFLDYINDSIKSTEDVDKFLHLPTLALIPSLGNFNTRRFFGSKDTTSLLGANKPELLINQDPRSALSEAYRQLRTSILLSTAGRPPKLILITSTLPSEGKTTTTINIATSLAQMGSRVLIIDGDMRRPQIHKNFGISNQNGLSRILSSSLNEDEILDLVQMDNDTGVHVITSGSIPPNPAELLGSDRMKKTLNVFVAHFDFVIMDSPPVITCTDAILMASIAEGTILVVKSGKTPGQLAQRVKQKLGEINAKIIGTVLNKVDKSSSEYYYSYYNHYYYTDKEKTSSIALSD